MRYLIWFFLFLLLTLRIGLFFHNQPIYPNGTKIRISGKVTSEPIRYESSQRLSLSGFRFYLPLYPEVNYGDNLTVEGVVEGNNLKKVKLIKATAGNTFLYKFRNNLLNFYNNNLPYPHSVLVSGMVIGAKSDLGSEFWNILKESGTAHVVVASGMNVTLVAGFLVSFLTIALSRRIALPIACLGIWFYALISGFDAPIIRASIMGTFTFFAQELGRLKLSLRILFLTVIIMLLIWPFWIGDVGFWLSFLATLSIILFEEKLRRILKYTPKYIRTDFSTTISAQIGVSPLLYYYFGQFNILSPLINVAVIWTIPYITIAGMIGGILGLIYQPIGKLILLLSYPLTSWFILVVNLVN